ncbi:MAG: ATP-dependent sacrificial sulfur transferase LarE [Ktedonobacterales bacterium]|nr:ATP-dependent sacrificial sulfur transferase LarE [Ktedonobacterales bacterium]
MASHTDVPSLNPIEDAALGPALAAKYARLRATVQALGSVLVAYSGGVDSALLLKVAHDELGDQALGALAISPAYDDEETAAALAVAAGMGISVVTVATHEMENPAYVANGPDRCFHCKDELFDRLAPLAAARGLAHIAYGVNRDDLGDYRPGQKAARQHGVQGPLLDAEMGKDDIRALAQHLGVPVWNKPALACYSSRIPYGTTVTVAALRRVGQAERLVRSFGFARVRVRHHDSIARIEVDAADLPRIIQPEVREPIERGLRELGYLYVTLDLRGYRMGSLNESLRPTRAATI